MVRLLHALRITSVAMLVLGGALISACSQDPEEQAPPPKQILPRAAKRVGPAKNIDADMVAAPSTTKSRGQVDLKFVLTEKPEVGQPVDIHLALIPNAELDHVLATFQPSDGLELRGGAKTATYEKPVTGVSISHTLTVVPSADGIFFVTATVTSDSEATSVSRTFTIPLIAGEGLSASNKAANNATPSMANAPAAKSRQ